MQLTLKGKEVAMSYIATRLPRKPALSATEAALAAKALRLHKEEGDDVVLDFLSEVEASSACGARLSKWVLDLLVQ